MRIFNFLHITFIILFIFINFNWEEVQGRSLGDNNNKNNKLYKLNYYDNVGDLFEYYTKWKYKPKPLKVNVRQDTGQVVPILTPSADLLPDLGGAGSASDAYLPDLGFIADFGTLVTRDFPASPLVRLSRDLFESEQCAQFVSCETSKFSRRHSPLNWIHEFLQDFPFKGDLADRLKIGSEDSVRLDKCGFNCNPLATLTRGLRMLSLLHEIVRVA